MLKVLVIDDSENMQRLVKTILFALGVEQLEQSSDAHNAYQIMGWFEPDLLICDWNMAPVDGITFTRKESYQRGYDGRGRARLRSGAVTGGATRSRAGQVCGRAS